MSSPTVPIPEGASVQQPIPEDALVEAKPGSGVTPPLNQSQAAQLRQSYEERPTWRKALGLAPADSQGQQLDSQMMQQQKESIANSPMAKDQVQGKLTGAAILGSTAAVPLAVEGAGAASIPTARAVGTVAGTAVRLARTPVGQWLLKKAAIGVAGTIGGAAFEMARRWMSK